MQKYLFQALAAEAEKPLSALVWQDFSPITATQSALSKKDPTILTRHGLCRLPASHAIALTLSF